MLKGISTNTKYNTVIDCIYRIEKCKLLIGKRDEKLKYERKLNN